MKSDSVLVTIAVVAVLASFAGLLVNYGSFSNFNNLFTGFATENGTVNVSIGTSTLINITSANGTAGSSLNWGGGTITDPDYAFLVSNGTVPGGQWPIIDEGFIIQNIGNTNVNLSVYSTDDAASFIGKANAWFQYNLTNYETGSCSGLVNEGVFTNFTTSEVNVCQNFLYGDADTLRMDILLKIPSDATDTHSTTVVLSYEASA